MLILDFTNVIISMLFLHDSKYLYTKDMKMGAESIVLYKLIVLYMLDRVNFTLTNSQISDFILEKGYTNYFTLQEAINGLIDSDFVYVSTIRGASHYKITDKGEEALSMFENRIPYAIKQDILDFFEKQQINLRKETEVQSDYYLNDANEYTVSCVINERNEPLLDIKYSVQTQAVAVTKCDNLRLKSTEVYDLLVNQLWTTKPSS